MNFEQVKAATMPNKLFLTPTIFVGCVITAIALLQSGCQKKTDTTSNQETTHTNSPKVAASATVASDEIQLLSSDVITVKAEQFQPSVNVTGTLQPSEHTAVQSTVNAQVQQVLADVGKAVAKGEPLVRLDITDSKNQLAQAQADVAAAQAQLIVANKLAQRNKILLDQGFVSQIEYERSMADAIAQRESINAKQAKLNSAKKMYGDTTLYAPTTGIISSRSVNVGQVVAPNQPLMEIIDPNKLEFAANVPSEAQTALKIGQNVPFDIGNIGGDSGTDNQHQPFKFMGQISRISPQVDAVTRQLTIYVTVKPSQNNRQLRAGMYATGQLDYGQAQVGVLVPMSAVILDMPASPATAAKTPAPSALPTATVLLIDEQQLIQKQAVQIIKRYDNTSQYLLAGIKEGTTVITAHLNNQDVGKKVRFK